MQHGVVVIGDTLTDGTRPVLRAAGIAPTAFEFDGGVHGELRNLVLEGFPTGVALYGLQNLTVSNVDYQGPTTGYSAVGVDAEGAMDTLRVVDLVLASAPLEDFYSPLPISHTTVPSGMTPALNPAVHWAWR